MKKPWSVENIGRWAAEEGVKGRERTRVVEKLEDEDMGLVQILWAEGGKHY